MAFTGYNVPYPGLSYLCELDERIKGSQSPTNKFCPTPLRLLTSGIFNPSNFCAGPTPDAMSN